MELPIVELRVDLHKNMQVVLLKFPYQKALINCAKKMDAKWSQSKKSWYVAFQKDIYKTIIKHYKGLAWVDATALFNGKQPNQGKVEADENTSAKKKSRQNTTQIQLPAGYLEKLLRRRHAESTIKTYCSLFKAFQAHIKPIDAARATQQDIQGYLDFIVNKRKLKPSTQNQIINAIKFYYEQVLGMPKATYALDRPIKSKTLPKVLSLNQIKRILRATKNIKHKAILGILYSAGLRNGEVVSLRKEDILWDQNLVLVRGGKGKKDRSTLLAESMHIVLKRYLETHKPQYWLFEGANRRKYSQTSVRKIFNKSQRLANIEGHYRVHDLRHSFATHLIEKGINLRYVQEILGHESSKTTEIYTHVAKTKFTEIKNPLDDL